MTDRFETFVLTINRIYRCIQRIKDREMEALGLKGSHVMCLFQLRQHPEGLTAAELAERSLEDKAAVSRAVARLEELGLVERTVSPRCRREKLVSLTPAGAEAFRQVQETLGEWYGICYRGFTPEERERYDGFLTRIVENVMQFRKEEQDG